MPQFAARVIRDPQGYEWIPSERPKTQFLRGRSYDQLDSLSMAGTPDEIPDNFCYDPLEAEPALYRIFARLDGDESEIAQFATRYGAPLNLRSENWHRGMSHHSWALCIVQMGLAVQLADDLLKSQSVRSKQASLDAAHEFLQEVTPRLSVRLVPRRAERQIQMQLLATDLLDAMYLQLIEAVVQEKQYRDCELCQTPFELMPGTNRSDRVYCSENCRVKAYQRRKRHVVDLFRLGRSVGQIVDATGLNKKTVLGWVKNVKEK